MSTLAELLRRWPLPREASAPTAFQERVDVAGLPLHLVGLSSQLGQEVYAGSAGDQEREPIERAYFELLERLSIGEALRVPAVRPLWSAQRQSQGSVTQQQVFQVSEQPSRYRYALSNGVALGQSWPDACARAAAEAVERDAVLRSWFGLLPLQAQQVPAGDWGCLEHLFELQLRSVFWLGHWIVIAVGFPREPSTPLIVASGARQDLAGALAATRSEFLQRLGFLWGELIPSLEPQPAPNPDYHQEYCLWSGSHARLRQWLDSRRLQPPTLAPAVAGQYIDLTPPELSGVLHVARAWTPELLPLVFGVGYSLPGLGVIAAPHPIA